MKGYIKKLLRGGLLENINLNLSKQIRSKQMGLEIDKELEGIFGKNIYRLYYDLSSGKQITPRNKKPKLRFDIDIIDRLRDEVEVILDKFNFTLVDFDKNIAKSNKAHGQKLKKMEVSNMLNIWGRYRIQLVVMKSYMLSYHDIRMILLEWHQNQK